MVMRALLLLALAPSALAFSAWTRAPRRAARTQVSMGPYRTEGAEVIEADNRKHSTAESPLSRKSVIRTIERATKESFQADVYSNAELEKFVSSAGQSMYPKLMKKVSKKAKDLGVDIKADFADGLDEYYKQRPRPVKEPEPSEEEEGGEAEAASE